MTKSQHDNIGSTNALWVVPSSATGLTIGEYPTTSGIVNPHQIQVSGAMPIQPAIQRPNLVDAFKPKRAGKNPKLSHIVFVLDESSSMDSCWDSTISGYNEYLTAQKLDAKTAGIQTLVSLFKFNGNNVDCIFDRQDVQEVTPLTKSNYRPNGGTNLHDAMGGVMMKINTILSEKKKDDRESVIITVLTDGEENQSDTFMGTDIKAMVEKAEAKNWGFMFLGANINAFHAGANLGFSFNNTMQYNVTSTSDTMRAASNMTSRMKSAYASGMSTDSTYHATAFSDTERAMSLGDKNAK